jgi:hypothetical protein
MPYSVLKGKFRQGRTKAADWSSSSPCPNNSRVPSEIENKSVILAFNQLMMSISCKIK